MTLDEAKRDLEKFVKLKTTLRPAFVDVLLDAQEVKHGHWVLAGYMGQGTRISKCSICGWQTPDDGNYCSNCGAKMDEVKDETE